MPFQRPQPDDFDRHRSGKLFGRHHNLEDLAVGYLMGASDAGGPQKPPSEGGCVSGCALFVGVFGLVGLIVAFLAYCGHDEDAGGLAGVSLAGVVVALLVAALNHAYDSIETEGRRRQQEKQAHVWRRTAQRRRGPVAPALPSPTAEQAEVAIRIRRAVPAGVRFFRQHGGIYDPLFEPSVRWTSAQEGTSIAALSARFSIPDMRAACLVHAMVECRLVTPFKGAACSILLSEEQIDEFFDAVDPFMKATRVWGTAQPARGGATDGGWDREGF